MPDNLVGEGRGHDTGVPTVNAVVRDRNGAIKLAKAEYSDFDPGFEVYPTVDKLFPNGRAWLDGYKPINIAGYLNYQAALFDDRLNVIAGIRRQSLEEEGQFLMANYPWYIVPVDAWKDPVAYQAGDYVVYDLTLGYPWSVADFKLRTSLGISNVTDEEYSEGSFAMSPARNWLFSNTLEF